LHRKAIALAGWSVPLLAIYTTKEILLQLWNLIAFYVGDRCSPSGGTYAALIGSCSVPGRMQQALMIFTPLLYSMEELFIHT